MFKKMRELQTLIAQKSAEAKGYLDGETKDLAKADALLTEVEGYQQELELLRRADKADKAGVVEAVEKKQEEEKAKKEASSEADAIKALADAARAGFCGKGMNEGTGTDGGYTVPEDIQTKVNRFKEQHFSLARLIDYEAVKTMSGRRTYKSRAHYTGFTQIAEGGSIAGAKKDGPKFDIIDYAIKKYAAWLPATNELLEDSDAAIANLIIEWLGMEEIATENAQILAKINTVDATAMTGLDDIKKAVNVTLAAFAGSVSIITNADGLQYLDTLKDGNDRYLLSPDPANPMQMRLAVGARTIPIVVVPNDVLATAESGAIPVIVGDLKEFMKEFDRKQLTITQSNVATIGDLNAYEDDLTLFRAIMRADWVVKDSKAIVRGELTIA